MIDPNRIPIGEVCRAGALDLFKAWNERAADGDGVLYSPFVDLAAHRHKAQEA
jgi:hypothetical protein